MSTTTTSANDIKALRDELFTTLRALNDPKNPMDVTRARAVADVAQVVINSAKVEVEFMELTGAQDTGFISSAPALPPAKPATIAALPDSTKRENFEHGSMLATVAGVPGVTRHKLRG